VPGRGTDVRLRLGSSLKAPARILILTMLAAFPSPGTAQETELGERGAGAFGEALLRLTPLAGESRLLPGGRLGFRLTPHFRAGGGAASLPKRVGLTGGSRDLGFGYGGVWMELGSAGPGPLSLGVSALVGTGRADVRDIPTGVELGTRRVRVLEPEATTRFRFHPGGEVGVGMGWRLVDEAEELPGLPADALGGWTVTFSLRLQPRP